MQECVKWCAIGDSFTYLDSHLDETGYRVEKGYLTRTAEKLGFPVKLYNLGINGSSTSDWIDEPLLPAASIPFCWGPMTGTAGALRLERQRIIRRQKQAVSWEIWGRL